MEEEDILTSFGSLSLDEDVTNEVLALQAIFTEQLELKKRTNASRGLVLIVCLVPSDMESVQSFKQFLSLVLHISVSDSYPDESPSLSIEKQRGFSDQDLDLLHVRISSFLQDNPGGTILYELILYSSAQDHPITDENADTIFTGAALGSASDIREKKLRLKKPSSYLIWPALFTFSSCPVCRKNLSSDSMPGPARCVSGGPGEGGVEGWRGREDVGEGDSGFDMDFDWSGWREKQREMDKIFQRQTLNGGIIDLHEEDKRFLVTEETTVVLPSAAPERTDVGEDVRGKASSSIPEPETPTHHTDTENHATSWQRLKPRTKQHHNNFHHKAHHHYHHHHSNQQKRQDGWSRGGGGGRGGWRPGPRRRVSQSSALEKKKEDSTSAREEASTEQEVSFSVDRQMKDLNS